MATYDQQINPVTGKSNAQVLAESTAAAQKAAQVAGLTFTPGATINSGVITPTQPTAYSTPIITPPPPITPVPVADPYALSSAETDIQNKIKEITSQESQLQGKSAYQAEQNTAAGVDTLQKDQADLADQINALSIENQALPLQMQADYQGRATASTIQGKVSEAQRDNTIKALLLQAQLAGKQNKLSYAQSLADKAVGLKYDPIQEQIDVNIKNLELLSKDPSLTIAEKKRADAQLEAQQQKQQVLNEDKTAQSNILSLANNLIANGFTDSNVLSQIQNAKDSNGRPSLAIAQQIAANTGMFKGDANTQLVEVNNRKLLINTQTGNIIKDYGTTNAPTPLSSDTTTTKPATQAQQTAAGYATRTQEAESTISDLQNYIVGKSVAWGWVQQHLPSGWQDAKYQQYDQAARNFINAVLRPESGAAIAQSEFDNAYKQYIPQPGDNQNTLAQKAQNRLSKFESLKNSAGSAFSGNNQTTGGQYSPGTQVEVNGKNYVVGEDGDTLLPL